MASIQLTREQAGSSEGWPRVCVRCGVPAEEFVAVPKRRRGKDVEALNLPLCADHREHWEQHARQFRRAVWITLGVMGATALLLVFGPEPVRFGVDGQGINWVAVIVVPLLAGIVALIGFAIKTGNMIRVSETNKHWLTLLGVSSKFAQAWKTCPAVVGDLAASDGMESVAARIDVMPYKSDGICPAGGTAMLFTTAIGWGLFIGCAMILAAEWLEGTTQGWKDNDVRFLGIVAGLLAASALLVWLFIVGKPSIGMLVVYGAVVAVLTLIAGVLALIPGKGGAISLVTLTNSTSLCLFFVPMVFLGTLINHHVYVQKIRGRWTAGLAGLLGTGLALAVGCWYLWDAPAFAWTLPIGGGIVVFFTPLSCASTAGQPFCTACDTWMSREVLGGLSRPPDLVERVLKNGEIVRLANEQVRTEADVGDVELGLYYCPNCQQNGNLVLHAVAIVKEGNKSHRKDLGYWVYPGNVWPVLQALFPNWKTVAAVEPGEPGA